MLQLVVVGVHDIAPHVDPCDLSAAHAIEVPHDVGDLAFEHEEDRAVIRVRAVQHEQIREASGGDAEVRLRAVCPRVVDACAAAPANVDGRRVLGGSEAGAENDGVDLALYAVVGDHARRGDAGDVLGDELDMGTIEGWVVHVGRQRAATSVGLGRRELGAQVQVVDSRDIATPSLLGGFQRHRIRIGDGAFDATEDLPACLSRRHRVDSELLQLLKSERRVVLGQHPIRGALEKVQPPRSLGHLGYELHGARGAADHGDAVAGQVVRVIPTSRVEHRPGELVETSNVGHDEVVEHADGTDEDVGLHRLSRPADR